MRKFLVVAVLLGVGGVAVASSLPNQPHIVVTGRGVATATPDMAVLSIEVFSTKPSSAEAKRDVDSRVNDFLAAIAGIEIESRDVVASNLLTEPDYEHRRDGSSEFRGFMATRSLEITLRDLEKLNDLMDLALAAGLEQITEVHMTRSNESELREVARRAAIEDSKNLATRTAADYGARVGPVYSIDFRGWARGGLEQRVQVTGSRISARDLQPGTYLSHTVTYSEQITAVFLLDSAPN